jgi:hypothetical protein
MRAGAENTQRNVGQVVWCRVETLVILVPKMVKALRQWMDQRSCLVENL